MKKLSTVKKKSTDLPNVKRPAKKLYIVGIGASAGGLEAFEVFFKSMPENSGMAFVLVAHMDPTHSSLLPELIQNKTLMKVSLATEGSRVLPNSVYVIPPNMEMTILHGKLKLRKLGAQNRKKMPIDVFFTSLAGDQRNNAIAIILSGTGSDGSQGIAIIKDQGGTVIAQDKASAKYFGMPGQAVATGMVDFVLPPEKMPEQLIRHISQPSNSLTSKGNDEDSFSPSVLEKIFEQLQIVTEHDFSLYKKNTICRRIERRMHVHHINKALEYVQYLKQNKLEANVLFKELLIGVTSFFRDPAAFESLKNTYLPALLQDKDSDYQIRIWVPGCSTGEEVYSLAIILKECMNEVKSPVNVQIFGTDICTDVIDIARCGKYPEAIAADISPERLAKFFTKNEKSYQIKKVIREMVAFAPQSVIKDPPFTKLDMISCRNLLIYFGPELQQRLFPIFHYSLKPGGMLFLGSSETIGQHTGLFSILDKRWKIFARSMTQVSVDTLLNLPGRSKLKSGTTRKTVKQARAAEDTDTLQLLKTILSQSNLPASVVIDDQSNILYIHGRTGRYLEPAEGAMSNCIVEMARPGLKAELSKAILKTAASWQETVVASLQIKEGSGHIDLKLTVRPLSDLQAGQQSLMIVVFEEVPKTRGRNFKKAVEESKDKSVDVAKLRDELEFTRETLQNTIGDLETANEELKSNNEELQSTNEELQSTNEELETSKEELQSTNEELITVNAELESRIEELVKTKDDIKNLLDATNIATIFLDIDQNIRRFTPKATEMLPLANIDIGRPISNLASNLKTVNLQKLSLKVLENLVTQEDEVVDNTGRTFRMKVCPYRTTSNLIDGTVITFEDITGLKVIESRMKEFSSSLEKKLLLTFGLFMISKDPVFAVNKDNNIIEINEAAQSFFGESRLELLEKPAMVLFSPESYAQTAKLIEKCRKTRKVVIKVAALCLDKSGKTIPVFLSLSPLDGKLHGEIAVTMTGENGVSRDDSLIVTPAKK